jgi:hypothetical protein
MGVAWGLREKLWQIVSVRLAAGARGLVTMKLQLPLRADAVFFHELKALSENPAVTELRVITQRGEVLFTRPFDFSKLLDAFK